jgi:hypothetical protein
MYSMYFVIYTVGTLKSSLVDPVSQSYVFGPPGFTSGSVSHKYESGSGSASGAVSVCFWAPGSASGAVRQSYGSEDPDPHPDPYQNVTDPQH